MKEKNGREVGREKLGTMVEMEAKAGRGNGRNIERESLEAMQKAEGNYEDGRRWSE